MSSTISKERAAARARLERQMAEKLERARKRKQRNAIIGAAAAVLLVAGGVTWAILAIPSKDTAANADDVTCMWTPDDATQNPDLKDVGAPPTGKAPHTGTQTMTIESSMGQLVVEVNTAAAPCTARSMTYLAGKGFFDNTKCHRLVTGEGLKVLQCGDPTGKGTGGPTYKMNEENLPNFTDDTKNYPIGTIAMANTGQPGSTGSQFFIVWGATQLPGNYTVLGKVTQGIELVQKMAEAGAVKEDGTPADNGDGAPKTPVTITKLTVTPAQ